MFFLGGTVGAYTNTSTSIHPWLVWEVEPTTMGTEQLHIQKEIQFPRIVKGSKPTSFYEDTRAMVKTRYSIGSGHPTIMRNSF